MARVFWVSETWAVKAWVFRYVTCHSYYFIILQTTNRALRSASCPFMSQLVAFTRNACCPSPSMQARTTQICSMIRSTSVLDNRASEGKLISERSSYDVIGQLFGDSFHKTKKTNQKKINFLFIQFFRFLQTYTFAERNISH